MSETEHSAAVTPPGEPARSLRLSIFEGGAYTMMIAVTASQIRTFYAASLGATDADFSLLTAMGTLATLGAVVGAHIVGQVGSRRKLVMTVIWNRLLWIVPAVVAFLPMSPRASLYALMAVVFVTGFLDNVHGNAWLSWMSDLMPPETRSRYLGKRSAIHGAIGMAANLALSRAFDFLRVASRLGASFVYAPFFLFAGLCGWASAIFMGRHWEPPAHGEKPLPFLRTLTLPFSNENYRRLIIFYVLWTIVTAVSTPFWVPQMINNLHMSAGTIALYGIFSGVIGLASQPLWGRAIDRYGSRPVMAVCIVGVSTLPLFWLFAKPGFLWAIWGDASLTGLFWPGFNLAALNLNIATAPRESRAAYLASISVITGITGFLSNLLGGVIAVASQKFHYAMLGQFPLVNYHIIFVFSAFGRLALLPVALRLHEHKAESVGVFLDRTGRKVTETLSEALQSGIELIKRMAGQ